MSRMSARNLPIFVLALVCAAMLIGGPPQTSVTVNVRNTSDKPVDNATVILDFVGSHQFTKLGKRKPIHWEIHTDQQGIAHFPPVPQGTIQLQVVAKNYQTFGNKFDIDSIQKSIDVRLNHPQEQYSAHPPLKPAENSN